MTVANLTLCLCYTPSCTCVSTVKSAHIPHALPSPTQVAQLCITATSESTYRQQRDAAPDRKQGTARLNLLLPDVGMHGGSSTGMAGMLPCDASHVAWWA